MTLLKSFILLGLLATLVPTPVPTVALAARAPELRVGIFPMPPLNFVDAQGNAQGLNPDLLRETFHRENVQLVFVPGSWGECYDRLMKGEIDLLTTVAYSVERAEVFDFNQEPVADIWGRVYSRVNAGISNISDLADQPVAIARKDINGSNFLKTAEKFQVKPRIVEVESHEDIFAAIQKGDVVAGVVPQHFGFREAKAYGLVPTTIEFEPFSVYFATQKGRNSQILAVVDEHLAAWKATPDSVYYNRVAYWMGGRDPGPAALPRWVYIALLATLGSALLLVLVNFSLKRQVRLRTRELASREALFRRLSETTRAVPWELDLATGEFSYIGPRIVDMFGYPRTAWSDLDSWTDKVHPDDRDWALSHCTAETAKGIDHDFVYRGLHKDGRTLWIHDIVTVISGPAGPKKLYGYFVDITELREHEQRFQKMFREHGAIMLLVDPESGTIVDANDAACRYYGYPQDQMTDLPLERINISSKEDIRAAMRSAMALRRNYFEFKHRLADGENRDIEAYSYPIVMDKQPVLFAILHDITERKRLSEESGRNAQLAALGTIAAGVAHEINNPIQGIINYADILKQAPERIDRIADIAERIKKEGERIAKITRELLNYSRDNRNEKSVSDVTELIQGALSLMTTKIRSSGINIATDLDPNLPPMRVNPQGIQQIVMNLVDNAYDALRVKDVPVAGKSIQIRSGPDTFQGQPAWFLEVQDNGIGMSETVVRKARDVFFSTKPSTEGTGLGLSIVSDIVAKHQGQLEIDSAEGKSTRMRVTLPIDSPPAPG